MIAAPSPAMWAWVPQMPAGAPGQQARGPPQQQMPQMLPQMPLPQMPPGAFGYGMITVLPHAVGVLAAGVFRIYTQWLMPTRSRFSPVDVPATRP